MSQPSNESPRTPVRVPVLAIRPSPTAFAKQVWSFASGATGRVFTDWFRSARRDGDAAAAPELNAMTFAPVATRETGAAYLIDEAGIRLVGSSEVAFDLTWHEIGRVGLQVQRAQLLGLKMLRLVLWPSQPQTFLAAHPECRPAWDEQLGAVTVAVATSPTTPQASIDLAKAGLAHAGECFDGRVEELSSSTD